MARLIYFGFSSVKNCKMPESHSGNKYFTMTRSSSLESLLSKEMLLQQVHADDTSVFRCSGTIMIE